jgi:ParB family transcriptional regulator, chromosome partitioning protein
VLAGLPLSAQVGMADEVIRHKLTVRALERRIAAIRDAALVFKPAGKSSDWQALERDLSDQLGYPVSVSAERSGEGELRMRFHSLDELEGLLARIGYRAR